MREVVVRAAKAIAKVEHPEKRWDHWSKITKQRYIKMAQAALADADTLINNLPDEIDMFRHLRDSGARKRGELASVATMDTERLRKTWFHEMQPLRGGDR